MNVTLERVGSHTVTFGHYGDVEREELYPYLSVVLRGEVRSIRCECDRYLASSGLTPWRVVLREVEPGDQVGPATREALRAEVVPLVLAWLESDAYVESRAVAFAWALAHEARGINTTADYRFDCAIKKNGHELHPADLARIRMAADLRMQSLHLLDGQPAGAWSAASS